MCDELSAIIHDTPYMIPTPSLRKETPFWTQYNEMVAWDHACWELVKPLEPYATGQSVFEAYWRTLAFTTSSGSLSPSEYRLSYSTWISGFMTAQEMLSIATAPKPRVRAPHLMGPTLAVLNLCLVIVYYRRWPTSVWGWTKALLLLAAANGCCLLVSSAFQYSGHLVVWWKLSRLLAVVKCQAKTSQPFDAAFNRFCSGRKFCVTTGGLMGWAPLAARSGDRVCVFQKCELPFVVRREGSGWRLLGECYMHGMMTGLSADLDQSNLETITLI